MSEQPDESTLMDQLMHHIRDNIYFKDREGHFILINDEGARRAGYSSPDELIGKTDLDIFTDEHGSDALRDEQRILESGVPLVAKEEKETWTDGHETWVSTTKVPLRDEQGEVIGTFGISRDITLHKQNELLAAQYAEENRRLCDELESDLQMAAELQKTFLPTGYPVFPEGVEPAESAARFCHLYHSTGAVGGDFCSVRKLSDTEAGILLCDVTGHGVRSALITALIRAVVEEITMKATDPGIFLDHLNKVLTPIIQPGGQSIFATACYLILDVEDGSLRYAIAGHPVPVLLNSRTGTAEWLTADPNDIGPALALNAGSIYHTVRTTLHPMDAVIMYTDGLYEVTTENGEQYGKERLLAFANQNRNRLIRDLFPDLLEEVADFCAGGKFEDDVCLVGCRFAHPLER